MKNKTMVKKCVLYDRDCIDCGECNFCDLNPLKICDNCGKCLHLEDCATIKIDGVYEQAEHGERGYSDHDCGDRCDGGEHCSCGHTHDHTHGGNKH